MPRRIPGNHWHDSRRAGCRIARRPLWLTEGLPDRPFLPTAAERRHPGGGDRLSELGEAVRTRRECAG